jgi:hypothetical protein
MALRASYIRVENDFFAVTYETHTPEQLQQTFQELESIQGITAEPPLPHPDGGSFIPCLVGTDVSVVKATTDLKKAVRPLLPITIHLTEFWITLCAKWNPTHSRVEPYVKSFPSLGPTNMEQFSKELAFQLARLDLRKLLLPISEQSSLAFAQMVKDIMRKNMLTHVQNIGVNIQVCCDS